MSWEKAALSWAIVMRRLVVLLIALVALGFVAAPAGAQSDDDDVIIVTALHAIPGENDFPVDVYLDDELAIAGFTKMMRSDPFELEPGTFTIKIYASGADPSATDPALEQIIELTESGNYALVAHLADGGQPIIAIYSNDLSPIPMGQGRLVVRQTADVGSVDVTASGELIATGLRNTGEVTVDLPAGIHQLIIVPEGGGEPLADVEVELVEGELTAVFAITTLEGNVVDLAVQTVTGAQSTPSAVPTGTGGLAAPQGPDVAIALALLGLAALGAAALVRPKA
jgi:hypothetical protein